MYSLVPKRNHVGVDETDIDEDLDEYGVNPDMDSLEYNNNIPDWNHGTLEENNDLSMYGLIAIVSGLGVIVIVDTILAILMPTWFSIAGLILALLGIGGWVWGFMKWQDSQMDPSKWTAFRSWKINFLFFWVDVGIAGLVLIFTVVSFFVSNPMGAKP